MMKANQQALDDFRKHLISTDKSKVTIEEYLRVVRRFLRHIGNERLEHISEDLSRSFFAGMKGKTRRFYATVVSQFLNFSVSRLPVPVTARGAESPRVRPPTKKELALRQRWSVDKLIEQKESADDLIAKLARKVIDGYLLSQQVVKGEYNLDDFVRYADECREIIETNLPLFMGLSSQGRNIHSAIDQRVQR